MIRNYHVVFNGSVVLKLRISTQIGNIPINYLRLFSTLVNPDFTGVVSNSPVSTKEVALGDTVVIDNQKISDWMYLEKGVLRGGYTIRAIYYSLSLNTMTNLNYRPAFDDGTCKD